MGKSEKTTCQLEPLMLRAKEAVAPAVLADKSERLLVGAGQAAKMLSIGRSHFYSLLSSGQIGPMAHKLGNRSLFSARELREWVDAGIPSRDKWIEQKKS